jgi:hypothetical protein
VAWLSFTICRFAAGRKVLFKGQLGLEWEQICGIRNEFTAEEIGKEREEG